MFKTHDLANTHALERCADFPYRNKMLANPSAIDREFIYIQLSHQQPGNAARSDGIRACTARIGPH